MRAAEAGDLPVRLIMIAVLLALLAAPAIAQDIGRGADAFKRGDYAAAVREWRPLAEQGHIEAQYLLGSTFRFGKGVPQDYVEAERWLRKAAEQGLVSAQSDLGEMHAQDSGAPRDYGRARYWYGLAAAQGDSASQNNLGVIFSQGLGVLQDFVQAHKWFNLAAAQGVKEAATNRDAVAASMTPLQLAEAQRLASAWRPTSSGAVARVPSQRTNTREGSVADQAASIQHNLALLGYDPGPPDGVPGPRTRAAIRAYEVDAGRTVTGDVSAELDAELDRAVRAKRVARNYGADDKPAPFPVKAPELQATGSGFRITTAGAVLTNRHVVADCVEVRVTGAGVAAVVAMDPNDDLALLAGGAPASPVARFRGVRGIRAGEAVMVAGFPLQGVLTADLGVATGTVSALAGPRDDRRFVQITAPVQLGNSGGPLLDQAGRIVGVIVGKLNAIRMAKATGDIPQNVNFAIGAGTVRAFLDAHDVPYEVSTDDAKMEPADIAAAAKGYTVRVECWK